MGSNLPVIPRETILDNKTQGGEPRPPCNRIIREGDVLEKCWICGSTLKRWFFKVIGCIQPKCPNYYGRRK